MKATPPASSAVSLTKTMLAATFGTTCLVLLVLLATGCRSPVYDVTPAEAIEPQTSDLLKEGDVLQIVFPGATNLNTVAKIPLDGKLRLQFVEPVQAADKTPAELQAGILAAYGTQLQVKEVTVTLISSSATVYLSGAVLKPGRIPLERPMTVLEAIMEGGGFDPNRAKLSDVTVIRYENGKQQNFRVNLKETMAGRNRRPFYVKPFDVIYVPVKSFSL